jgi:hypothetical protein
VKPGSVVVAWLDPGTVSACFMLSVTEMYLYDAVTNKRIIRKGVGQMRSLCGTGGLPDARNETVRRFLDETDGEWLFSVDSDMGFAPDTVDRLVESCDNQRRVMGALTFQLMKTDPGPFSSQRFIIAPVLKHYVEHDDEVGFTVVHLYPPNSVLPVSGTGAACLLIHRDVLKKVRDRYGDEWFSEITHPTGKGGKPRRFSEDLSFCVRLAACGIPLHVNTGVKTTHDKGGIFLDEDAYARQQTLAVLEAQMIREAEEAVSG